MRQPVMPPCLNFITRWLQHISLLQALLFLKSHSRELSSWWALLCSMQIYSTGHRHCKGWPLNYCMWTQFYSPHGFVVDPVTRCPKGEYNISELPLIKIFVTVALCPWTSSDIMWTSEPPTAHNPKGTGSFSVWRGFENCSWSVEICDLFGAPRKKLNLCEFWGNFILLGSHLPLTTAPHPSPFP